MEWCRRCLFSSRVLSPCSDLCLSSVALSSFGLAPCSCGEDLPSLWSLSRGTVDDFARAAVCSAWPALLLWLSRQPLDSGILGSSCGATCSSCMSQASLLCRQGNVHAPAGSGLPYCLGVSPATPCFCPEECRLCTPKPLRSGLPAVRCQRQPGVPGRPRSCPLPSRPLWRLLWILRALPGLVAFPRQGPCQTGRCCSCVLFSAASARSL